MSSSSSLPRVVTMYDSSALRASSVRRFAASRFEYSSRSFWLAALDSAVRGGMPWCLTSTLSGSDTRRVTCRQ